MQILLFGGTGFVGQHAAKRWTEEGHEVLIPSRRRTSAPFGKVILYEIDELNELFTSIKGEYAIVNLAGESINSGRWSKKRKQTILDSRTVLTGAIAQVLESLSNKPIVWINASAIGYYGYSDEKIFDETSVRGDGYLAEVCELWERATAPAIRHTRVVRVRIGLVLGGGGGALPRMTLPYKLYVGGKVGKGSQWVSWVHIDDLVGIMTKCLTDPAIQGPVNATSPAPLTMNDFGKAIAEVYRRPHWLPVPGFALKLLFGEMSEIILQGQRVLPNRMKQLGYEFKFKNAFIALKQIRYVERNTKYQAKKS